MSELHPSQLADYLIVYNRSKLGFWLCAITAIGLFSSGVKLDKHRPLLMGTSLVTLTVGSLQRRQIKKISKQLSDIEEVSNFNFKSWVRQQTSPSSQLAVTVPAIDAAWNPEKLITNPVEYIHQKQKHVALVGGTGDGKSTFTQYLSSKIGGRVIVYDSDAKPDDWNWIDGSDVIGRKGDFKAINQGMDDDLSTLEELVQLRGNGGDSAIQGRDRFLIAEEFPILVDECDSASKWLKKHAKRGRRYKQFILAIAQNDSAENFGLQNDKGTLYSCFCLVRLGQFGIDYARTKLKDDQLVQWLKLGGKKRFLIDDYPCELDLSNWGINQLLPSSETKTLEPDNELKTDLNEYEQAIIDFAKNLNGDVLKARILKQKSRFLALILYPLVINSTPARLEHRSQALPHAYSVTGSWGGFWSSVENSV